MPGLEYSMDDIIDLLNTPIGAETTDKQPIILYFNPTSRPTKHKLGFGQSFRNFIKERENGGN